MSTEIVIGVLLALCFIWFCTVALYFYNAMWLHPQRIRNKLRQQGIDGPPPSFLHGNIPEMTRLVKQEKSSEPITHDYTPFVLPYFEKWRKRYGMLPALFFLRRVFFLPPILLGCFSDLNLIVFLLRVQSNSNQWLWNICVTSYYY